MSSIVRNSQPEGIRVLVIDGTRMSTQLLVDALVRDPRFLVSGLDTPSDITAAVAELQPQVVLISENLENQPRKGYEIAREVRLASSDARTIIMLDCSSREVVIEAFHVGARGLFSRSASLRELYKCIQAVAAGQVWATSEELGYLLEVLAQSVSPSVTDAHGTPLLSRREQDVVRHLCEGLTNREIASRLGLSENTVKNYIFRIFDKLGVSSRVEVLFYVLAQQTGAHCPAGSGEAYGRRAEAALLDSYLRAADQGNETAQLVLGRMFSQGEGVDKDNVAAYMWFLLAERSGSETSDSSKTAKDDLAQGLEPHQIVEAERRASEWARKFDKFPQLMLLQPAAGGAPAVPRPGSQSFAAANVHSPSSTWSAAVGDSGLIGAD